MRIFAADCHITAVTPQQLLDEREELMLRRYAGGVTPMPGLREILARFDGRLKLAIATSSPSRFTDVLLPALNIARFFDVVQTGDDIVRGKPDPEIYFKAISRLAVRPQQCVVLEDSPAGVMAGHGAGAHVIAVPSAEASHGDFSPADSQVADLHQAAEQIEQMLQAA